MRKCYVNNDSIITSNRLNEFPSKVQMKMYKSERAKQITHGFACGETVISRTAFKRKLVRGD